MSMFNIALSGLNAAKQALNTTSHNIANANNPNYTRQEVVVTSVEGVASGSGAIGRGVNVQNVRRLDNEFLTDRLNQLGSQLSFSEARAGRLNDLDRISSNSDTSLEGAMQAFFQAAQDLSVRPSDDALRQSFLFAAEEVATRFNGLISNAASFAQESDTAIELSVENVNRLSSEIAELNLQISDSTSFVGKLRIEPNDLIDRRDGLLKELSSEMELQINPLSNGRLNISTKLGVPLVSEGKSFPLQTKTGDDGVITIARKLTVEIAKVDEKGTPTGKTELKTIEIPVPEREFGNAKLGGLVKFRDSDLASYIDKLKSIGLKIDSESSAIMSAAQLKTGASGSVSIEKFFVFDKNTSSLSLNPDVTAAKIPINTPNNGNDLILRMASLFSGNAGSGSIRQDYRNLITSVANSAAITKNDIEAKGVIRDQIEADRSGFSGVNLDEEAANLLRYQQAYSASGKVIGISRDLFQELLDIAGR